MSFAFVRVTGTAARVPGTGENSSERLMERGRCKTKPLKSIGFQRLEPSIFLNFFGPSRDLAAENSSGLALLALLEIVGVHHEAGDVLAAFRRDGLFRDPERVPERLR